jgi:3alpha(or 20beta)-hydroxysteroid dehydrogenase
MGRLSDQVVLISGGAGAFGHATAAAVIAEGAAAVLADIDEAGGHRVADELGDRAAFVHCDITAPESWRGAVAFAGRRFGPVSALVGTAGTTAVHRLEELDADTMLALARVNQFGAIYGMQAVFGPMRDAGRGSIVNVTTMSVHFGFGLNAGYAGAKAAVRAVTLAAAVEWARHGIRANTLAPGIIDSPMSRGGAYQALSNFDDRVREVPLRCAGTVEQVAAAILFLISDESAFITGADLVMDGGQTAGRLRQLA